jgi:hypothetical protein
MIFLDFATLVGDNFSSFVILMGRDRDILIFAHYTAFVISNIWFGVFSELELT